MATRSLGQLTVDLIAKTGGFEQGMERASRTAQRKSREIEQYSQKSAQSVQQAWGMAGAVIGGALAGISVGAVFDAFIRNTVNAQNEQAQLAAVLKSTGNAAGYTVGQMNDMASAMEKATAFSAGEINQAQYTLAAFTGIVGQEFPRALQAAADMAARTGMTVKSAAETIGRALDIPSQGLNSLTRQGFKFNDDQKRLAEQLEATGRKAEAQAIVLSALEESYGGAAEAARDTLGGALSALQNTISSLLTSSDSGVEGLRNAIEGLNNALGSETAKDSLSAIVTTAQILSGVLVARLAASAIAASASFVTLTLQSARVQTSMAGMAGMGATAASGISAIAVAARVASASLSFLGGPIGAVIFAVGGGAYAWSQYSKSTEEARQRLLDISQPMDSIIEKFRTLSRDQQNARLVEYTESYEQAAKDADEAFKGLVGSVQSINLLRFGISLDDLKQVTAALDDARESGEDLSGVLTDFGRRFGIPQDAINTWIKLAGEFDSAKGSAEGAERVIRALKQALDDLSNTAGPETVANNMEQYRKNYEKFMQDFATPQEKLKSAIEEQKLLLGELYSPDVEKRLRDRFLPKSRGGASATKELEGLVKQLQLQQATLGMTEAAAGRYRIEVAKGSEADRARALALYDQIQAWKEADRAIQQAAESSRYIAAINRELDVFRQQQDLEIAGVGMGDRQREQLEKELVVRQDYAERRRQLEEAQQVESTRLTEDQYQRRISALQDAENRQIDIVREAAARKREAEGDWVNGMTKGLQNYADEVANVSNSVAQAVGSAFKGMEDAMVEFVTTGKADFTKLADSILKDMARIAIQQAVMKPFANWFGGLFTQNALGGVYDSPSLSRYSNQVHTSPQLFAFANGAGVFAEAGPEAIMPLSRGADGRLGVKADLSSVAGRAGDINIIVNVSDQGATVTSQGEADAFGNRLAQAIRRAVQDEMARAQRPGGQLWNAKQGAY